MFHSFLFTDFSGISLKKKPYNDHLPKINKTNRSADRAMMWDRWTIFLIGLLVCLATVEASKKSATKPTTKKPAATTTKKPATTTTKKPTTTTTKKPTATTKKPKPIARLDARVAVKGDDTKEKIPTKEALFTADLKKGITKAPDPDAYPGLSDYQRERLQCRDSDGMMHQLAAIYMPYGFECTYYECEYNADINAASWMLSRDIFKCCFEDKHGYHEGAVMKGRCTQKVCKREGEDNHIENSVAWEVQKTNCTQCAIGLVMLERGEHFYTGDPCLSFKCVEKGELKPIVNRDCCELNKTLIAHNQLAMTTVADVCEVSTCKNGSFTNQTNYQPLITNMEYVSGCPVYWTNIQGTCYMSYTKPLTLEAAARACSELAPARNSKLIVVDFGGMIGTMSDVMELGRWYWLTLRVKSDTPKWMWDNTTTPERFLVGDGFQPTVKRVNRIGKLAFEPAEKEKNAYVCQMDHSPSCKPTGWTERPPTSERERMFPEEL